MSNGQLEGKVALITGGAMGVGLATAQLFVREGARVAIVDMNREAGIAAASGIGDGAGGSAFFVQADISDPDAVQNMVAATVARFGRLDIAINNAAIRSDDKQVVDLDTAYWAKLMGVALTGTALCIREELRQMVAQGSGGSIVNITSGVAHRAFTGTGTYSAAKGGIEAITRVAAVENAAHKIRVNAVAPGVVNTKLVADGLAASGLKAEDVAKGVNLLNRFAEPEEIANAILWIASDKASFVTGTTLHADGGYTA